MELGPVEVSSNYPGDLMDMFSGDSLGVVLDRRNSRNGSPINHRLGTGDLKHKWTATFLSWNEVLKSRDGNSLVITLRRLAG